MTTPAVPVLLLGGTGRTGRRVADRLRALGHPVRTGSRRGDPPFSWEEPQGWPALLSGVRAGYVAYAPDLALPQAEGHPRRLGTAAVEAGVPVEEAEALGPLFAEVLDGRNEHLTDDVGRVLGREPRSFADVVRRAAASGAWDVTRAAGASC